MIVIGLTGSIGMGKSTTAAMFAERGVPVFDSDAAVHRLYTGRAVPAIEAAFPGTTTGAGVDREELAKAVLGNPSALARLEAIVHPMVREERDSFLAASRAAGAEIVLLDVPLLFESGGDTDIERVVVVTAPPQEQRRRVLERPGMTVEKYEAILARQMPDAEKRKRADFIVDTGGGIDEAARQVDAILAALRRGGAGEKRGGDA